jgi:hypothetical protein
MQLMARAAQPVKCNLSDVPSGFRTTLLVDAFLNGLELLQCELQPFSSLKVYATPWADSHSRIASPLTGPLR